MKANLLKWEIEYVSTQMQYVWWMISELNFTTAHLLLIFWSSLGKNRRICFASLVYVYLRSRHIQKCTSPHSLLSLNRYDAQNMCMLFATCRESLLNQIISLHYPPCPLQEIKQVNQVTIPHRSNTELYSIFTKLLNIWRYFPVHFFCS